MANRDTVASQKETGKLWTNNDLETAGLKREDARDRMKWRRNSRTGYPT